jgi:hypothetical protein
MLGGVGRLLVMMVMVMVMMVMMSIVNLGTGSTAFFTGEVL